jgi:hypothetical protein
MQGWLVAGAWLFALVFAVVVLGFLGYELSWKSRRLAADRDRLNQLVGELNGVSVRLQHAAERARRISSRQAQPTEPFVS